MCGYCRDPILGFARIRRLPISMRNLPPKNERDGNGLNTQIKKLIEFELDPTQKTKLNKGLKELGEPTTLISSLYTKIKEAKKAEKKNTYLYGSILLEA